MTPIRPTPLSGPPQIPHRHFYLPKSLLNFFTKSNPIKPIFYTYREQVIMKPYTEDDINQALYAIANSQSLQKAALE